MMQAAIVLLEMKYGCGKDIEAGLTLLEMWRWSDEAKAANALLDIYYTEEEVDPENVPYLHLRCHGKDTCFKARDGNAILEVIQERNSRELENRPGSSSDAYAGETTCRICRLDRKKTYPGDAGDATEGDGSGADNFKAGRWGAAKYDGSRYARAEFGQDANAIVPSSSRSRAQIQLTSAAPTEGNRRRNQTVARQQTRNNRKKAVCGQDPAAPKPLRQRKQRSVSVPRRSRVSKNIDERGPRLRAGTRDLLHPPTRASAETEPAEAKLSTRFQRELDTSLVVDPTEGNIADEESLTGRRRSGRARRQTLKAKESWGA